MRSNLDAVGRERHLVRLNDSVLSCSYVAESGCADRHGRNIDTVWNGSTEVMLQKFCLINRSELHHTEQKFL